MYGPFTIGYKYLKYWFTAANGKGHGIHSPFVYNFIEKVLNDKQDYPVYIDVEKLRDELKKSGVIISVDDFGAGSVSGQKKIRKVADIARLAAKPEKYAQLLFRITRYYNRRHVLEIGTSLGITTAYLSKAANDGTVVSLEGANEIATLAKKNLQSLSINNTKIISGNFDESLEESLAEMEQADLVFFDGNHRYEPTVRYFHQCRHFALPDAMFIFDDIHWSQEMEMAWETIKADPAVTCTIDLFFMGIVLFNPDFREKQHFVIRF